MSDPRPSAKARFTGQDVGALACNAQSPKLDEVPGFRRVRCNRLAGHAGPHRRLRSWDFAVIAEWNAGKYTVRPPVPTGHA